MRIVDRSRLYSASDLVNYMGCDHATLFDLRQLTHPVDLPADDAYTLLLQEKGLEHEAAYLQSLRQEGRRVVEVPSADDLATRAQLTVDALKSGADVIYQGALFAPPWHGYSDFLVRRDGVSSALGDYAYDIADTKLARRAKPKHVLQLCVYADLLKAVQGVAPPHLLVALGGGGREAVRSADVGAYYEFARRRFEAFVSSPPSIAMPEPCSHCAFCRWRTQCETTWGEADHLSLVANITKLQRAKLTHAGVSTMAGLGAAAPDLATDIRSETFVRLKTQARLQTARRERGDAEVVRLALAPGRGFNRMPAPAPGDLFFDMEGDPLFEGGLEYLFGVLSIADGKEVFSAHWAHDRENEKRAFEACLDAMVEHLAAHPDAHIYHYASYEESALKRLAMYHGTREKAVDDLLRGGKLIDLHRILREAVQIGEPSYSLKDVESYFFETKRSGDVTTAGDSIVMYERWRRLGDAAILEEIRAYNELDCRSTWKCRDWLIAQRPGEAEWRSDASIVPDTPKKQAKRADADAKTAALTERLLSCVDDDLAWRQLLAHLLEFHRREAKPAWWAQFTRAEMSEEELIDDAECIGALTRTANPPWADKKSMVFEFVFPPQDFKFRIGDEPVRAETLEPAGEIVALDEETRTIALKLGPSRPRFGPSLSIIPKGPVGDQVLRDAIYRFGDSVTGHASRYSALIDVMRAAPPRFTSRPAGASIIDSDADVVGAAIRTIADLDRSCLLIQGPPGAGKTHLASHAVVELLKAGKRVGVASHSHKAINALLTAVDKRATDSGVSFRGIKKASNEQQFFPDSRNIENTLDPDEATDGGHQLIAGTAWVFARPNLDQRLDYLFIDEGGQVSLANVLAMGVSTRNIVLIGDQMQLAQPIQGDHPGGSGRSALEHMLGSFATVPADRGVFLPVTRRMHPSICQFISDAVYEGRLHADEDAARQRLILNVDADPDALAPTGLRFVDVVHEGCAQRSPQEAERLKRTYDALLGQRWSDREGVERELRVDDILVVTPYNMQANLLQSVLPDRARVGTVDKFQGQQAPVVLISMTTSSGDDLPRQIEFLYSKNRLNVAVSRARCLAVIFANPRLLEIGCNTIAQMRLVNTLCWAKLYSEANRAN